MLDLISSKIMHIQICLYILFNNSFNYFGVHFSNFDLTSLFEKINLRKQQLIFSNKDLSALLFLSLYLKNSICANTPISVVFRFLVVSKIILYNNYIIVFGIGSPHNSIQFIPFYFRLLFPFTRKTQRK
jgi:hypothetical protein